MCIRDSWYEDFLDFCKKESIMPSHLAIHIYSCMDNPVSYTHLDVYKRQSQNGFFLINDYLTKTRFPSFTVTG